jgi:hypothetical protein
MIFLKLKIYEAVKPKYSDVVNNSHLINRHPKAMMNIEIPLTANNDLFIASRLPRGSIDVEDCGNIGPVGG